jgi:pilus assembly protein CpaF
MTSAFDPDLGGRVRHRLAGTTTDYDTASLAAAVRDEAPTAGLATLLDVSSVLSAELQGAGVLAPLLADPEVTDVLVNGAGPVWVDRGTGPRPSGLVIEDEAAVRRLAIRLVAVGGRRLDEAAPYADARLADGTRVHAVVPPLAPDGTCISLRVPPRRVFTLDGLVAAGSLPPAGAELLQRMIDARVAFLLTGGTGTGKTTVLSSLLSVVREVERIVLVEDAAELRPDRPHVVRLEARPANAEGFGAVALDVLVRQALRMRPDRLVVGEVRGGEVLDLLAALNTGHEGGCSTVHANRAEHLPARIESLCGQAGVPRAAAHSLLVAAVDVVLHLTRGADGRRRMAGLAMLVARPDGTASVVPAYVFGGDQVVPGPAASLLDERLARS